MNRAQKSQQETTTHVKLDRQQKRMAAKKYTSYQNKKTKTTKRTGYGKPNYQKIKKHDEVLRKAARHTRLIEKRLAACTTSTISWSLGLYDGFIGSDRDYIEIVNSEYLDPFLPDLNTYESDDDCFSDWSESDYLFYDLARDIHQENIMARFDFP